MLTGRTLVLLLVVIGTATMNNAQTVSPQFSENCFIDCFILMMKCIRNKVTAEDVHHLTGPKNKETRKIIKRVVIAFRDCCTKNENKLIRGPK